MRFLGEILVNLQFYHVFFAFEVDDGSSPTFVLFCNSQRKCPLRRFVSDDFFRFQRWQKAISNQNDRDCRYRSQSDRWFTRHKKQKVKPQPSSDPTGKSLLLLPRSSSKPRPLPFYRRRPGPARR